MAYSKANRDKIKHYLDNPEFVREQYIELNKTNAQLAIEWGLPDSTVYSILKKCGLIGQKLSKKLNSCNESLFDSRDPMFCYLTGLISADGYIDEKYHRVCIRMNEDAKEMLEDIRDYFNVSNPVVSYINRSKGQFISDYTLYDLTISSRVLIEELRKLNIYGRKKDLLVRFPDMSKLSEVNQEMYMRGLWDGDGTIRPGR